MPGPPIPFYLTATAFAVYQAEKGETGLRSEAGDVEREKRRPLHPRRAVRLGFFGETR